MLKLAYDGCEAGPSVMCRFDRLQIDEGRETIFIYHYSYNSSWAKTSDLFDFNLDILFLYSSRTILRSFNALEQFFKVDA